MITGHTRILAHLGVPTEAFKAPMIYNPYFEAEAIDVVCVPMGVEPDDYPALLRLLFNLRNIAGALVTMPYKVTTVGLIDEASPRVAVAGACNAVKRGADGRLIGDMFDGDGFVRAMLRAGRTASGARALVVGAGGVGSAIAASLAGAGLANLTLFDRNPAVAEALAARLAGACPELAVSLGSNDPAGHDIVVNATPLGMQPGDDLPLDPARLAPESFVGEVVMARQETPFVAAARDRGCLTRIGTDMLFEQIPAYLDFFDLPSTTPDVLRALAQIRY